MARGVGKHLSSEVYEQAYGMVTCDRDQPEPMRKSTSKARTDLENCVALNTFRSSASHAGYWYIPALLTATHVDRGLIHAVSREFQESSVMDHNSTYSS